MEPGKSDRGHIIQAFLKISLALAGKTDDNVGAQVQAGDGGPGGLYQAVEAAPAGAPGHLAQDAVAAALQGQMQMGQQPGIFPQREKIRRQIPRLQRRQA